MNPLEITVRTFADDRGWFRETWSRRAAADLGIDADFCQDNHSCSRQAGTIRGIHFQKPPFAQAKLVRCLKGSIFDVAVDIRTGSPSFGKWTCCVLSAELGNQYFVPAGFAHGFMTLESDCEVAYKVDSNYAPHADSGVIWNDPTISIDWPSDHMPPVLSEKDNKLPTLSECAGIFEFDTVTMVPLPI